MGNVVRALQNRPTVALVQRFVPHYNLVFYEKLLTKSIYDWEFLYGDHPGNGESGLSTSSQGVLPTRQIRNFQIGKAVWQRGVTKWLRRRRYQAVVFELGWQIVSNPILVGAAHQTGAVAIPWTKGIAENGTPRTRFRQLAESVFIRRCDALIVYGQVSAEYFLSRNYPKEGIFIAQNTVDVMQILKRIPLVRERAAFLKSNLGLHDTVTIGYLGRLVPEKRVELIIEAFAELRQRGVNSHLVIAGDGPERVHLQAKAEGLGIGPVTHFIGLVPELDADAVFQMFDIFVSAYSAGLAILEALAHGNVVVVTPERRPEAELVLDGITGFVTTDFSVDAMVSGLGRAVTSIKGGRHIGQAGQEAVASKAPLENMINAFDRAITYAIERKEPA
jgi:glycosyltransferase involved in cell wall biosynthesis